jgi:hypothetical protein
MYGQWTCIGDSLLYNIHVVKETVKGIYYVGRDPRGLLSSSPAPPTPSSQPAFKAQPMLHREKKYLEKEVRKVHTIHVNNVIHGRRRGGVWEPNKTTAKNRRPLQIYSLYVEYFKYTLLDK